MAQDDAVATSVAESPELSTAKLRLTKPHSLIKRTLEAKEEKDQWGYVRRPAWQGVDVRVSKGAKRSALAVLDRLFKALEKREIEIRVFEAGHYESNGTFAVRGHYDKVQVYVSEDHKKVPHTPTAAELRYKEEHKYSARIAKSQRTKRRGLSQFFGALEEKWGCPPLRGRFVRRL